MNHWNVQMSLKHAIFCTIAAAALANGPSPAVAQMRATTITRVFWQDRETQRLSYADVTTTNQWNLKRGWVTGFPKLDAAEQSLGHMNQAGGLLALNVTGASGGWVAIDSGAYEEPHGNHTHWKYNKLPATKLSNLKSDKTADSRSYVYDNQLYVTDPALSGFTKANPSAVRYGGSNATRFFKGGSGKMAVAAVNNAVAYATHEKTGQVDVVNLLKAPSEPAYGFTLGAGDVSAATANSGKAFFAHEGGISWVFADTTTSKSADSVQVNKVADSSTSKTPMAAVNSFANQRNWIVFTDSANSTVCLINAAAQNPQVVRLPIAMAEGLKLSDPSVVLSLGKRYAFVFQERTDAFQTIQEQLTVIELDPNRDRDFSDAKVKVSIPVGASRVSGGDGHHGICFDAYGRHGIITDPADGILSVMSVQKMAIVAKFQVGGIPDRIMAVGAPEHFH